MAARTRLGLTLDEVADRAAALEVQQERQRDPSEQAEDHADTWWHEGPGGAGHVVAARRRDPLLRRIEQVEAAHLLDQVLPGRVSAPWSRLPYGDAIDRVLDQMVDMDQATATRLAASRYAALAAARAVVWDAARAVALAAARAVVWDAAQAAASDAAQAAVWDAARDAAWDAAQAAVWDAARDAAWDAAWALVVANLVGQHGLTRDHVETLLAPWIAVMGDPREA